MLMPDYNRLTEIFWNNCHKLSMQRLLLLPQSVIILNKHGKTAKNIQ